jgi:flagellar protein FlaG
MDGISAKPTDTSQVLGTKVAFQNAERTNAQSDNSPKAVETSDKKVKFTEQELDGKELDVKFAYDEKLEELYVMVYDRNSEKLLRKIPSEDAMNLSIKMKEIVGVLLDKNA